jgi:hypothetical protein
VQHPNREQGWRGFGRILASPEANYKSLITLGLAWHPYETNMLSTAFRYVWNKKNVKNA